MTVKLHAKHILALVACLLVAACLVGCSSQSTTSEDQSSSEEVTLEIYAANSLEKALNEVQELYTSENPNVTFADTHGLLSAFTIRKRSSASEW